jgi:hypothetical protein
MFANNYHLPYESGQIYRIILPEIVALELKQGALTKGKGSVLPTSSLG